MSEPTDRERREADALRRALEADGGAPPDPAIEDVREAAALLRWSDGQDARSPERHAELRAELLAVPAPAKRPRWLWWAVPAGGFAAAAAALVLVLPSCVIALGNRGASPHPHEDCPICSEHMESGGEHASAVGPTPSHYEHVLVGEEPVLATSR